MASWKSGVRVPSAPPSSPCSKNLQGVFFSVRARIVAKGLPELDLDDLVVLHAHPLDECKVQLATVPPGAPSYALPQIPDVHDGMRSEDRAPARGDQTTSLACTAAGNMADALRVLSSQGFL